MEIQGNQVKAAEDQVDMEAKAKESIQLLQSLGYNVRHCECFDYLAIPEEKLSQN